MDLAIVGVESDRVHVVFNSLIVILYHVLCISEMIVEH